MTEQEALKRFIKCANLDDFGGALEALKYISAETLNRQDGDDYDMLIQATVNGNPCAVEALLKDGRCDITHWENLCGRRAYDFAMDYPEDSRIRQAFLNAPPPEYIFRNGELIRRGDIYDRIMDGTLEADEGCFSLLEHFFCADLVVKGKVSKEDFESWINPKELYWEGQIALLMGDEEYGKKFVNWEYIRDAAEPDEWLSFLRDLPQYAGEADWRKLIMEGSPDAWRRLLEVRPAIKGEEYWRNLLEKYNADAVFNFSRACEKNDVEAVHAHLVKGGHPDLNANSLYSMPPGFLQELPLAVAVKANAADCVKLLLKYGADPNAFCRKNGQTPRQLAGNRPEILNLFNREADEHQFDNDEPEDGR